MTAPTDFVHDALRHERLHRALDFVERTRTAWYMAKDVLADQEWKLSHFAARYLDALDAGSDEVDYELRLMRRAREDVVRARAAERLAFVRYYDASQSPRSVAAGPADERYLVDVAA